MSFSILKTNIRKSNLSLDYLTFAKKLYVKTLSAFLRYFCKLYLTLLSIGASICTQALLAGNRRRR